MKWGKKNSPKTGSIFAKLLSGYVALTLLIVLLTALVSFFFVRQYTVESNKHDLLQKAETIAGMAAKPGGTTRVLAIGRMAEYQEICDARLIYINEERIIIEAPDDWPSYDDYPSFEPKDVVDPLDQQLWTQLLSGHSVTDVRLLDFMDSEVVFAGAPIQEDEFDEVRGAILLYRPLQQVSATADSIALMLVLAGVIALIVAIALAYVMGKRVSRPLILINNAAGHISEGNYGERVQITDMDEVGQLGTTLNLLSERLSAVIQNLNEEKSKLEEILTSLGEGIIAIDRSGRVVHSNPAALHLLGLTAWRESDADRPDPHQVLLMDMLDDSMNSQERGQTEFTNAAGRTIEAISSPILGSDAVAIGAVCLLRDVSEAQRLEQMRRDYIANISHELRTPLTGIRGMVEPLLDGYIDTEAEKQDCYRIIYQESMRLERLIGEMLDLSRLQDGRIRMDLEPMEAVELLRAAANRVHERANECSIRLCVEGDERLRVMGNEDRILQVLLILLDNALSFTPQGGSISLSANECPEHIQLTVRDSGPGIDPKDLPYIWERFFKADRSRLRTQGVGLGLPIAKLVVELMGGSISIQTELGKGTCFTIALNKA